MSKRGSWRLWGVILLLPACSFGFALSRILPPVQPGGPPMQQPDPVTSPSPTPSTPPSSGTLGIPGLP